ncbi:MAG: inositol monophosphatase [Desulfarculaceae bacterium]|nr:inositol monophosphatase [Desulfarculaceae bacterium]MCF8074009.1 inositol monophosphatase [Desulfarculaceae bacterium]MCF8102695.1 inositol monophosphatase [Desulfarculaceae bacterium]MCF8116064.1 inositol monophosphatase [Desulfarculaceae bacterium]
MTHMLSRATEAAMMAGRELRQRAGQQNRESAQAKASNLDLVTEGDRAAERRILNCLQSSFPDHTFLTEESGQLGEPRPGLIRWIIDPLDGTLNYVQNINYYAVSIAAELDGELLCGVIYQPQTDDLYTGLRGDGAFFGPIPLRTNQTGDLQGGYLALGLPGVPQKWARQLSAGISALLHAGATFMRLGSAALNLAKVAKGDLDGYWDMDIQYWDVAAGILMVREAGGVVTDVDGNPFTENSRSIVAGGAKMHPELLSTLQQAIASCGC